MSEQRRLSLTIQEVQYLVAIAATAPSPDPRKTSAAVMATLYKAKAAVIVTEGNANVPSITVTER